MPTALPALRLILDAAVDVIPTPRAALIRRFAGQAHTKDVGILAAAVSASADFLTKFNTRHFRPRKAAPMILPPGQVLVRIRTALSHRLSESSDE